MEFIINIFIIIDILCLKFVILYGVLCKYSVFSYPMICCFAMQYRAKEMRFVQKGFYMFIKI